MMCSGVIVVLIFDLLQFVEVLDLMNVFFVGYDWGVCVVYGVVVLFFERINGMVIVVVGYVIVMLVNEMFYELVNVYWYEWYVVMMYGMKVY